MNLPGKWLPGCLAGLAVASATILPAQAADDALAWQKGFWYL